MHWTAIAVDHWVAVIDGCRLSLKLWPMGWCLASIDETDLKTGMIFRSPRAAALRAIDLFSV